MSAFDKASDGRPIADADIRPRTATIAFIGGVFSFSALVMRVVESEFSGIDVIRVDSLAQLEDRFGRTETDLRIAVFDQSHAQCLAKNFAYFRSRLEGAQLLFGYTDVAIARRLYALQEAGVELRFLPMNVQLDAWISILRLLLSGQHYVPEEVLSLTRPGEPIPADHRKPSAAPPATSKLTDRELAVLARVSEGEQNKLIAEKLGVSEHTVKLHIHNAIAKISARNRTEAAIWYLSRPTAAETGSAG